MYIIYIKSFWVVKKSTGEESTIVELSIVFLLPRKALLFELFALFSTSHTRYWARNAYPPGCILVGRRYSPK